MSYHPILDENQQLKGAGAVHVKVGSKEVKLGFELIILISLRISR